MASKTTYIPRFLLPQHGPLWRSTTRTRAFARYSNTAEMGGQALVVVRYASGTPAAASRAATAASRLVSARTAPSRASSHKAAAKAAKASAPTKKTSAFASDHPATPAEEKASIPEQQQQQQQEEAVPASLRGKGGEEEAKPIIVLEKPERFNPPSHGKRLPRAIPKHYGGAPTAEEVRARKAKEYPGLPPPENTWSHWFIHSRGVHLFITLGTLTSLAVYTFAANLRARSPYADLIPPLSELPRHPLRYAAVCADVLRLTAEHESAAAAEGRKRRVEDVAKRNEYRKAHGLEPAQGWWGTKAAPEPEPAPAPGAGAGAGAGAGEPLTPPPPPPPPTPAADLTPEGKRKRFLGIF